MNNNNNIQNGDAMSGNEPTGARRRRRTKSIVWLGLAALCAGSASLIPVGGHTQAAFGDPMSEGMVCEDGAENAGTRTFDLVATDGYINTPDGNGIYNWGYGMADSGFQYPGPVLCAWQGETIVVNLHNALPVATSIQFPGQAGVLANGVPDGPQVSGTDLAALATEAGPGGDVHYSFVAGEEGTYLYKSGSDPQLQVQMGLFGALVVRPANITITADDILNIPFEDGGVPGQTNGNGGGMDATAAGNAVAHAACAYSKIDDPNTVDDESLQCDPSAIYDADPERENILMLSEIDPGMHAFMEQHLGTPTDLNWKSYPHGYIARYFFINGRSMPDDIAPNNAPWMPYQPYGAMAHVEPWDPQVNPLDAMLRYVAVGVNGYDFHPHSNHEHVIAEDGALMKAANGNDNTEGKFNIMVAPGSTVDATFRWTNEENYSDTDGKRVPVVWPQGLNLQEGDFWSGSPYLGDEGILNPGILTHTQCGEYYHVAHNHDLTMATNYGATFGGMLTLIKVEPPESVQAQLGTCD